MDKEYFRRVERWLYNIPRQSVRIQTLQLQIEDLPKVTQQLQAVPSFGLGVSDSTGQAVERRMAAATELAQLQKNIRLWETIQGALSPEEIEFVKLKYFEKISNVGVSTMLNLSNAAFYRKRNEIVTSVYDLLGGQHSISLYSMIS